MVDTVLLLLDSLFVCIVISRNLLTKHNQCVHCDSHGHGSAFICYLVVSMIGEQEKRRLEAENEQLIMLTAQFNTLKEKAEETRQARHDLRQHLRLISSYLTRGMKWH